MSYLMVCLLYHHKSYELFFLWFPHLSSFAEQNSSNSHCQQKGLEDDESVLHPALVQGLGKVDGFCEKKIRTFSKIAKTLTIY